jgi:hypothetical protein
MMMHPKWWADADTFEALFGLVRDGPQANIILTKLELCRAITKEYALSPPKASKFALSQWLFPVQKGPPQATEQAWQIFWTLQVQSTPLFLKPEQVSHIYTPEYAPEIYI